MKRSITISFLFMLLCACTINNFNGTDAVIENGSTDVFDETLQYDSLSLPECNSFITLQNQDNEMLWTDGLLFYIEVTPEQRIIADGMTCQNQSYSMNVYDLDDDSNVSPLCPNSANNVRIVPFGQDKDNIVCTDTGKIALDTVGQSSFRIWTEIPNFRLNVNTFDPDQTFPEKVKNIRLNNGQADATVLREPIAMNIWRAMGYPAPRSSFAQVRSNVWDTEFHSGAWSAYVLREQYKSVFFQINNLEVLSVWEGWGDIFAESFTGECQWSNKVECDEEHLAEIVETVRSTPLGSGFMTATENIIDWPSIHQFQCLSALTGTGDDWIHNQNNVVIVLRTDGKIQYLPYSVDISANHPWYQDVPYDGYSYLADACHQDLECRKEALTTCKEMIHRFEKIDVPTNIVDERWEALQQVGLNRAPDKSAYKKIREFYEAKPEQLRTEINGLIWMLLVDTFNPMPPEEPKF